MMLKALLLLVAGLACGSALAANVDVERLRAVITDTPEAVAPGCAVGVFRAGRMEVLTVVGYADLERKLPLNADTLFYAASVSKQFTMLSVAKLVEAGSLDLDDDVRRYLPELPQYQRPVTVRMLMLHTSGIRNSLGLLELAGLGGADKNDKDTALQLLFRQKSTNFTPGTDYIYSNGGYLLLAEIVERVSRMPFADFAKREVLDPMGMKRSFFLNGSPPALQNVAHGYVKDKSGEGYEIRDTYPRFSGSGGLMLTLNDLARYEYDIEVGHKVWTPAVRQIMVTPGRLTTGYPVKQGGADGLGYGGGLAIGWYRGQYVVQHGGGAEGFNHMIRRLPERRLSIAVLCNLGPKVWHAPTMMTPLMEVVEGNIFSAPAPIDVEDAQLPGRYYSEELQAYYDFSWNGDILMGRITSKNGTQSGDLFGFPLEFKRQGNGRFKASGVGAILIPYDHGVGLTLEFEGFSDIFQFHKIEAVGASN